MSSVHDPSSRWPALDVAARQARLNDTLRVVAGPLAASLAGRGSEVAHATAALWRRDPSLWSADTAVQQTIANRLGWLSAPALMADNIARLRTFADQVTRSGISHVLLLGMGGSSLAPEVLHRVVGVAPGSPAFHMLDSTDPAAVRAVNTPPEQTLYLLASKSGTTIEPNSLAAHFRAGLETAGLKSKVPNWADHFVAITDEGTALAERARTERFREVFINPSDIGGRYSAVSYFGLVPAALMGHDLDAMVGWSLAMLAAAEAPSASIDANPAAALGLAIGTAAAAGRDKLTLLLPPALEPLGLWIEQLVAESTGKQTVGVVPIAGETPAPAARYGRDRLFVRVAIAGAPPDAAIERTQRELESSGEPIVDITLPEIPALGAEFLRWEIATAIVGAMLRINPFDEPNVKQAKDATNLLLDRHKSEGRLPNACADQALPGGIGLAVSHAARTALAGQEGDALLTLIGEGDYFVLLAYLGPDEAIARALQALRNAVRDRTRAATMVGYGPRYLHSTGQLHKGGPNTGVFLLITAEASEDLPIPGAPFSFATLEMAQALGDFNSLDATGRRAVHVHLPRQDAQLVQQVADTLLARLPQAAR